MAYPPNKHFPFARAVAPNQASRERAPPSANKTEALVIDRLPQAAAAPLAPWGSNGANGTAPADSGAVRNWPEVMGTKVAAAYLGMSPRSLERWRVESSGPPYSKGPGLRGRIFYRRADLDAWLASRRFNSTSEYNR